MLGIAALIFTVAQQPDFVQPIQAAPILMVRSELSGKNVILGVDTGGDFDLLLKPGLNVSNPILKFVSPDVLNYRQTNFPSAANGILGVRYLSGKAIGVDARSGALSIWSTGNLTTAQLDSWFKESRPSFADSETPSWVSKKSSYTVLDLMQPEGSGHVLIDATVNGKPAKLGLDTGASVSVMDSSLLSSGFFQLADGEFGGINRNKKLRVGIADKISFGGTDVQAHPVAEAPLNSFQPAQGILGFDVLQNRAAIIDFAAHKLYLASQDDRPAGSEALSAFGINLAPLVGGKQFMGIIPDSPAAKAGLHSGDELLDVDGSPVRPENLAKSGSSLPIDFSKGDLPKELKISFRTAGGQPMSLVLQPSDIYTEGHSRAQSVRSLPAHARRAAA